MSNRHADELHVLPAGHILDNGKYEIVDILGQGGFGITYLAKDNIKQKYVAIKECFPAAVCARAGNDVRSTSPKTLVDFKGSVERFYDEAQRMAALTHPNIVTVRSVFSENNTAYMALEYLDGETLEAVLRRVGFVPESELKELIRQCLDALDVLHKAEVLHRDIAPDNIILQDGGRPVLIDFGAARESAARGSRAISASINVVKDGYSPIEFYVPGSRQGSASDLYSLAATIYRALTGEPPAEALLRSHKISGGGADPYKPLSGRFPKYSPSFLVLIDRALAFLYKDRPKSVEEWRYSLKNKIAPKQKGTFKNAPDGAHPRQQEALDILNGNLVSAHSNPSNWVEFLTSPTGRTSRKDYWLKFFMPAFALCYLAAYLDEINFTASYSTSASLLVFWPHLTASFRRLHDRGLSAWWTAAFYGLVFAGLFLVDTIAGNVSSNGGDYDAAVISTSIFVLGPVLLTWFIVLYCLPGESGSNKYGPDPLAGTN